MGSARFQLPFHSVTQYWLVMLLTWCAALAGVLGGASRLDHLVYDRALSLLSQPAPADVLIVAIDDDSIEQLGYWPWRRAVHAQLIQRLAPARAVGLDIIFAEPGVAHPEDDDILADAIRRHGRVVLPIVLQPGQAQSAMPPIAPLAEAAYGLGFINIVPDSDSVARRISLIRKGHDNTPTTLHFSLALLRAGGEYAAADWAAARELRDDDAPPMLIPYAGGPGHFRVVPYRSVLRGEIPAEDIAGKYVLVGAWATGLGDIFPTPVSHQSTHSMSGVEIIANILQAVRQDRALTPASAWARALSTALPVLLLCLLLPRLSPRQTVLTCAAIMAATLAGSVMILHLFQVWLPPSSALLMLMLCYPVWSWRSQEAALRYLNAELRRLDREAPPDMDVARSEHGNRSLEGRVTKLLNTLERVRNLRRFLTDSLDGMPDATLLVDGEGRLKFLNHAAAAHFRQRGISGMLLIDLPVELLLAPIITDDETRRTVIEALQAPPVSKGMSPWSANLEVRDESGQFLKLKCAPIRTARNKLAGTVITITDITAIRAAERQREETMRFISHDMRAPQNSILALIDLNQEAVCPAQQETLDRIGMLARRTLRLVDDFVDLSSAESATITPRIIDLADLMQDAVDELWAQARQRDIRLVYERPETPALTPGDDGLLLRALRNLVDNAVKYSPNGTQVTCSLTPSDRYWEIRVADQGSGISEENQERIFKPFVRVNTSVTGTGLGLAFVRIVAERHRGTITLASRLGEGSCFLLCLPRI